MTTIIIIIAVTALLVKILRGLGTCQNMYRKAKKKRNEHI